MKKDFKRIVYVPILHAREHAAHTRGEYVRRDALQTEESSSGSSPVGEMWAGIAAKIEELNLPWHKTRIYQDGLPIGDKESEIVARLAGNGSWNHRLLLSLLKKGAKLEGTENMDFLVREYDLLNALLLSNSEQTAAKAEYQEKSRELLKMRDGFILSRIKATLQDDEVGIIFMGVMHRLDKLLETDFLISYVIYRLPFRSVSAIYNA